jgi:hypothetical protein
MNSYIDMPLPCSLFFYEMHLKKIKNLLLSKRQLQPTAAAAAEAAGGGGSSLLMLP